MNRYSLEDLPSPPEVDGISPEAFQQRIADRYEPLVIRGLGADWPLVEAAKTSAQAAADYLKRFDVGADLQLVLTAPDAGGRIFLAPPRR